MPYQLGPFSLSIVARASSTLPRPCAAHARSNPVVSTDNGDWADEEDDWGWEENEWGSDKPAADPTAPAAEPGVPAMGAPLTPEEELLKQEIIKVEGAIVSSIEPQDLGVFLTWMIHGINRRERDVFIEAMRQGAPAEAVAFAEEQARAAREVEHSLA